MYINFNILKSSKYYFLFKFWYFKNSGFDNFKSFKYFNNISDYYNYLV